jgi:hypothetical protein
MGSFPGGLFFEARRSFGGRPALRVFLCFQDLVPQKALTFAVALLFEFAAKVAGVFQGTKSLLQRGPVDDAPQLGGVGLVTLATEV